MAIRLKTLITTIALAVVSITTMAMAASPAKAGTDGYVGEIMIVGFDFCPRGWLEASGQTLQIDRYEELFALIGTAYGGDGKTTFVLPDLRGRVPMHAGLGLGLSPRPLGYAAGQEGVAGADLDDPAAAVAPPFLSVFFCINVDGEIPRR
jgi:hypothetical protein